VFSSGGVRPLLVASPRVWLRAGLPDRAFTHRSGGGALRSGGWIP
jgi:hypothetical protein